MKRGIGRITKATFAVAAMTAMVMALTVGVGTASAETYKLSPSNQYTVGIPEGLNYFDVNTTWEFVDENGNLAFSNDVSITDVKSSNTKIAEATASYGSILIESQGKKGTATISYKLNGVAASHTFKVVYSNPISKFKVGKTSLAKKFNKKNKYAAKKTVKKKKVYVKVKTGWKITEYNLIYKGKCKTKKYKSGKKSISVKMSTKYPFDGIRVTVVNKKTGVEQTISYYQDYGNGYSPAG